MFKSRRDKELLSKSEVLLNETLSKYSEVGTGLTTDIIHGSLLNTKPVKGIFNRVFCKHLYSELDVNSTHGVSVGLAINLEALNSDNRSLNATINNLKMVISNLENDLRVTKETLVDREDTIKVRNEDIIRLNKEIVAYDKKVDDLKDNLKNKTKLFEDETKKLIDEKQKYIRDCKTECENKIAAERDLWEKELIKTVAKPIKGHKDKLADKLPDSTIETICRLRVVDKLPYSAIGKKYNLTRYVVTEIVEKNKDKFNF